MRPLHDQIIVRPIVPNLSEIIYVKQDATDYESVGTLEGEVVAVGSGRRHTKKGPITPLGVEVGERVAFTNHHEEMAMGDELYWVIQEADILGILEQ